MSFYPLLIPPQPLPSPSPTEYSRVEVAGEEIAVPSVLVNCFDFVLAEGLVEGIFRVSGSARRMKELCTDYSKYKTWLDSQNPSPHDAVGVAKRFLREYLLSLGGLFLQLLLDQLRLIFVAHVRRKSTASPKTLEGAATVMSALTSASEVDETSAATVISDPSELVDDVAHALATQNATSKNLFFLYMLGKLKELSGHRDETRMNESNFAIIFQPYLFSTSSLSELQPLQQLLTFLIRDADSLAAKYAKYHTLIGTQDDLETEVMSVTSLDSASASSPVTMYSTGSPIRKLSASFNEPRRRTSLSAKFGQLWDNYALVAGRPKRYSSHSSSGSVDKLMDLPSPTSTSFTMSTPHHCKSMDSLVRRDSERSRLKLRSQPEDAPTSRMKNANKRKSFIEYFRSNSSVSSMSQDSQMSPRTPAAADSPALCTKYVSQEPLPLVLPEHRKSFSLHLSTRFKRK